MNTLYTPINMRLSLPRSSLHTFNVSFSASLSLSGLFFHPSFFLPLSLSVTPSFLLSSSLSHPLIQCPPLIISPSPHPPLPSSIDVQCPWLWPASRYPRPLTHSASPPPSFHPISIPPSPTSLCPLLFIQSILSTLFLPSVSVFPVGTVRWPQFCPRCCFPL